MKAYHSRAHVSYLEHGYISFFTVLVIIRDRKEKNTKIYIYIIKILKYFISQNLHIYGFEMYLRVVGSLSSSVWEERAASILKTCALKLDSKTAKGRKKTNYKNNNLQFLKFLSKQIFEADY
jgi:hypothetical protein